MNSSTTMMTKKKNHKKVVSVPHRRHWWSTYKWNSAANAQQGRCVRSASLHRIYKIRFSQVLGWMVFSHRIPSWLLFPLSLPLSLVFPFFLPSIFVKIFCISLLSSTSFFLFFFFLLRFFKFCSCFSGGMGAGSPSLHVFKYDYY